MKTNSKSLETLFDAFADMLTEIVVEGKTVVINDEPVKVSPDASTLAVVRQFLKEQGVTAAPGTSEKAQRLHENLPFSEENEAESGYAH